MGISKSLDFTNDKESRCGRLDNECKIDYPLLKKTVEVELTEEDIFEIENILQQIEEIVEKDVAPKLQKKSICKSCAYYELCFI